MRLQCKLELLQSSCYVFRRHVELRVGSLFPSIASFNLELNEIPQMVKEPMCREFYNKVSLEIDRQVVFLTSAYVAVRFKIGGDDIGGGSIEAWIRKPRQNYIKRIP